MDFLILFITGLSVGIISAFFGIGGGAIMIPVLYWLYPQFSAPQVISISLGTIFINSSINSFRFHQLDLSPRTKTIFIFAFTTFIGASLGNVVLGFMNTQMNKKLFAIILILMVVKLLFFETKKINSERKEPVFIMALSGLLGSFISAITGLGGGIVYTPMFLTVAKLPLLYISAFSNVAMAFAALWAVIPYLMLPTKTMAELPNYLQNTFIGEVNIAFIAILIAGSWSSGKLGIRLNHKVQSSHKKLWLALLLLFFAIKMLAEEIS
jgi:uncharacterized membrane protein YfcA